MPPAHQGCPASPGPDYGARICSLTPKHALYQIKAHLRYEPVQTTNGYRGPDTRGYRSYDYRSGTHQRRYPDRHGQGTQNKVP
ncbi:hypothetical protein LIA77_01828 [Sarocladium implicatum]|nr:hypothetical protein LIA77_01828 [Sarocladium implicatum]